MARAIETAMCLAVLGVMAFSLQGCGDVASKLSEYKAAAHAAAAGVVQSAGKAAVTAGLKSSGGCPPLLAALEPKKKELITKVIEKVSANAACTGDLIKSAECQKVIAFELADLAMFNAEEDPGFKIWVAENQGKWDKLSGMAVSVLEGELMGPVKVMQDAMTDNELDPKQLTDVLDATMGEFCPASDAEVANAETKDAPLAGAAKAADAMAKKAKEAKFTEEVLEEKAAAKDAIADKTIDAEADATAAAAAKAAADAANVADAAADKAANADKVADKVADVAADAAADAAKKGRRLVDDIQI